jgi:hypothetical protein
MADANPYPDDSRAARYWRIGNIRYAALIAEQERVEDAVATDIAKVFDDPNRQAEMARRRAAARAELASHDQPF